MLGNTTDKADYLLRTIGGLILFFIVANIATFFTQSYLSDQRASVAKEVILPNTTTAERAAVVQAISPEVLRQPVTIVTPPQSELQTYITVSDSCGPYFEGECLRVRSGPGTEYPTIASLRSGMVLKVGEVVETDDRVWYKIVFDEWLRYPERVSSSWYVAGEYVELVYDVGPLELTASSTPTDRVITIDRSDQMMYAYEGDTLFMQQSISTGIALTPTPLGTFTIFRKTPSRYMQGPLPYLAVSKYFDLPGVPWNLYFTEQGAVVHGAYWHDSFGKQYSSGCVNVDPAFAKKLYDWAVVGTQVVVRD
jgi:hypothetical protein